MYKETLSIIIIIIKDKQLERMVYLVLESRLQFVTAGTSRQGLEMGCHITSYSQSRAERDECMLTSLSSISSLTQSGTQTQGLAPPTFGLDFLISANTTKTPPHRHDRPTPYGQSHTKT